MRSAPEQRRTKLKVSPKVYRPKKVNANLRMPRIAIVGGESLSPSHGTGMMFARHFSNYPKGHLLDVNFQRLASGGFFPQLHTPVLHVQNAPYWPEQTIENLNRRLDGVKVKGGSLFYRNFMFENFDPDWKTLGGAPDLIYSTCFNAMSFCFLHHVYRNLPVKVPIIQHFLDLDYNDFHTLTHYFNILRPAMTEIWSLTTPIWYSISSNLGVQSKMVQALQHDLSPQFKNQHRAFSKSKFKAVIVGNIWSGSAFQTICKIWAQCQALMPGLKPITWYGHDRRYKELKYMGINVDMKSMRNVIVDGGFLPEKSFSQALDEADMAIIAFSGERVDKEHYTMYSLPSRMGDYCAHGLPIFVMGKEGSEPFRLVKDKNMGLSIDPCKDPDIAIKVTEFIKNKEWRAKCGNSARQFAEAELDLKKYQKILYPELCRISKIKNLDLSVKAFL